MAFLSFLATIGMHFLPHPHLRRARNTEARKAFAQAANLQDFITRITLYADRELVPRDTLVIFDEIQELSDVITMAKFLVDDGRFDCVFTGSMLGTELKKRSIFPRGLCNRTLHVSAGFRRVLQGNGRLSGHSWPYSRSL